MDIFVTVMMVAMLLLVVIVGAAVFVQQSGTLRDIQHKLELAEVHARKLKDPEVLRRERVAVLDPLMLIEAQLYSRKPQELREDELELISVARARVMEISEDLKSSPEWLGPPYDLEWPEYLERMPLLKTLYLSAELTQNTPPQLTSGN